MRLLLYLGLMCGLVNQSYSLTCANCTSKYEEVTTPGCQDFKNYTMCLETATGCPLAAGKAALLASAHENLPPECSLTMTCGCQIEYWKTDMSAGNATIKCAADKAFFACMKGKTDNSCDNQSPSALATSHSYVNTCPTDTCECVIQYVKTDTSGADKCDADKAFINCMKGKTALSCDGATNAFEEAEFPGITTACVVDTSACSCEKAYAETDVTDATKKCIADTAFFACMKGKTDNSCDNQSPSVLATSHSYVDTCPTDTCECVIQYVKTDTSGAGKCDADKAFINCMKGKTALSCDGATNAFEEAVFSGITTACVVDTSACSCEKAYAETDVTDATKKCIADKAFFNCMQGKTGNSCTDQSPSALVSSHTYNTNCPTSTCTCVIDYLKTDTTSDKCPADKAFITCMKGKTDVSCDGTAADTVASSYTTIDADCIPSENIDACGCDKQYAVTDVSTTEGKCTADKVYLMCLKGKTNPTCDGRAANVVAVNHVVAQDCSAAFTDTCKCEVDLAKSDMSSNANKCGSYKTFLSCLKTAIGQSCLSSKTAKQVADGAYSDLQDIDPQSDCEPSPTCACEIAYAQNDITNATAKCDANGALVKCLRNKTGAGCVAATTVASLVDIAAAPVTDCNKTSSNVCKCEMDYTKGEKTNSEGHCSNAKTLLACLYNESSTATTCDGSSKDAFQIYAKGLITTEINGCELDDTCACEEMMKTETCSELKKGIACLRTATSRSCDGVKIVQTLADETAAKISTLDPACSLEAQCTCELNYTSADVSTDAKRCKAAESLKSCLSTAKTIANGVDLKGCDGTTAITKITSDMNTIIAKCGAMQSCLVSMTLVLVAAVIAHLVKN